jgi:hypothetical protein
MFATQDAGIWMPGSALIVFMQSVLKQKEQY